MRNMFNVTIKYNIEKDTVEMSNEHYKYLVAEIKRLEEAYQQAKSEAFQLQRQVWSGR